MKEGRRVVILGAGFGGLMCALTLARHDRESEVVLVDAKDEHTYSPWLYDVASAFHETGREMRQAMRKSAVIPLRQIIEAAQLPGLRFRKAKVTGVDLTSQHVVLDDGKTLAYDELVIALGSEVEDYGIPGLLQYAHTVKDIEMAMATREKLQHLFKDAGKAKSQHVEVVIGGAGATGTEAAAEIANVLLSTDLSAEKMRVTLLDAGPQALGPFPDWMGVEAERRLNELQVNIQVSTTIKEVTAKAIETSAGTIEYDLFLWAGGVRPNSVLKGLTLKKDPRGRILVDQNMAVNDFDNVYALGDAVAMTDDRTGKILPATAWVAMRQGIQLGKNLARARRGLPIHPFVPPKNYPAVIAVGGKYSIATIGSFGLRGYSAHLLRLLVDLHYFLYVLPPFSAVRFWWRNIALLGRND